MIGEQDLKENWELLVQIISDRFADGDRLDFDSIIYLIGSNSLQIAICN